MRAPTQSNKQTKAALADAAAEVTADDGRTAQNMNAMGKRNRTHTLRRATPTVSPSSAVCTNATRQSASRNEKKPSSQHLSEVLSWMPGPQASNNKSKHIWGEHAAPTPRHVVLTPSPASERHGRADEVALRKDEHDLPLLDVGEGAIPDEGAPLLVTHRRARTTSTTARDEREEPLRVGEDAPQHEVHAGVVQVRAPPAVAVERHEERLRLLALLPVDVPPLAWP